MSEQDEFYEQAFDELENDNRVKSIWAKAYAMSSDEESAKRLYIKFRVEQLEGKTSAKESQSEPKSNTSKQSVDKNKTSHTDNTTELHKDKIPFSQASTAYKSVFYGSVLVAIGLFFVGLEISNQVPAFLWAMVAFYTYKRNLTGAVTLQKAQIAFASAGGLAGIYLLSDSTPDIFLNLTSEQFLVPSIISIGVHLWLLRFFEKEKGEPKNVPTQKIVVAKDEKLPKSMIAAKRNSFDKFTLQSVVLGIGVFILIGVLTVTNEPKKKSLNSEPKVSELVREEDVRVSSVYPKIISFTGDRGTLTGKIRVEFENGIYEGEVINNDKLMGKYEWNSGDVYEGFWLNNKPSGKGKYEYTSGGSFDGTWVNGKKHSGKRIYADGSFYEGTFTDGENYNVGKKTWANGDSFNGVFDDDGQLLSGVYKKNNEYVFKGDWKKGVRTRGIMIQPDASGSAVTVIMSLPNSDIFGETTVWQRLFDDEGRLKGSYVGDFVMNKKSGMGQIRYGDRGYTGEWLNDQANGMGASFDVKTGSRVYGYFKDGSRVREYSLPQLSNYELSNYRLTTEYIEQITLNAKLFCQLKECDQFMKEHGIIPK